MDRRNGGQVSRRNDDYGIFFDTRRSKPYATTGLMGITETDRTALHRELELAEIAAQRSFYTSGSDTTLRLTGARTLDLGNAILLALPTVDALALNRVIGLGLDGPVDEDFLIRIRDTFQALGSRRFFVQVAPGTDLDAAAPVLEGLGFRHYNNWVRLLRRLDSTPPIAASDLRVRPIGPSEATSFGTIAAEAFEWSSGVARLVADTVGQPSWRHFMAFDGQSPVATGAVFATGPCAWIDFAATRPEYRGRGAQKALLTQRIREAMALGCKGVTVETAEERPDKPSPSYQNMITYGFEEMYRRPNYIYEF